MIKNRVIKLMLTACAMTCILGMETAQKSKATDEAKRNKIVYNMDDDSFTVDNVEVYYTKTQEDFDRVTEVLQNRKGKIIVEIITGTVLDSSGNGTDSNGKYIKYDSDKFSKGDKVQSVFVYNPESNALDDIVYRCDVLSE